MLGIAISIMVRHSSISHTMRQKSVPQKMSESGSMYSVEVRGTGPVRPEIPTWLKGAVVLVVLLGLTWVFGVLYLDNLYHTLIFSYVFTILNTLQGLFIFLFHCLLNDKVQKEYRRLIRRCHCLPSCLHSRYAYTTTSASREHSSSGNVMARFFRGKRRHSGCGDSSNNSAKPFLHKDQHRLSSSVPSSSDGVVSSRLSYDANTNSTTNNNRKWSHNSLHPANGADARFLRPVETSGVVGELSEVLDCSVVDSEFVSEYCQENLRVGAETKRYSTSSGDSGGGDELDDDDEEESGAELGEEEEEGDRLAALSVESLSKRRSYLISTSDLDDDKERKSGGGAESDGEEEEEEAVKAPAPFSERRSGGREEEEEEEEEENEESPGLPESRPLMDRVRQTSSELVLILNAANKPRDKPAPLSPEQSPSLTAIPSRAQGEGEGPPPVQHTSVPCLKFTAPTATTTATIATIAPGLPDDADADSVVSSLPNLRPHQHQNGSATPLKQPDLSPGESPGVKRHSSDSRVQFSPFRFSGSD